MAITCSCAAALPEISNNPCDAGLYGNQIVKIFLAKSDVTDFDGTLNNDATVPGDWQTKIAANDIVVLANLAGAVKESAEPNIEEGNDVPYSGADIIDKEEAITFDLKYLTDADFALLDQFACSAKYKMWFLDNNNYIWGAEATTGTGIPNVSVIMTTMSHGGIGTKTKYAGNTVRWNSLESAKPIAQDAGYADLVNVP